jgi:thiamine monophosphate kinase
MVSAAVAGAGGASLAMYSSMQERDRYERKNRRRLQKHYAANARLAHKMAKKHKHKKLFEFLIYNFWLD